MDLLRCTLLYLMFILYILQFKHVNCQDKNKGLLDDIIIEFINASYIDEDTFELSINYKDGENSMTIKIDVINELPPKVLMTMKLWGRALGQYKVPTGISMDVDICDEQLKKYFLETILSKIGVDTSYCPPKPGSYGIEDYNVAVLRGLSLNSFIGLNLLLDAELHSPPNISIMKLKVYIRAV